MKTVDLDLLTREEPEPQSIASMRPKGGVHVRVRGKGSVTPPTGTVTLLDGGRPIASTALTASTGATEDLRVTLHAGSHALSARYAGDKETMPKELLSSLSSRAWPGNVRELRNFIERSVSPG